jgi:DNA-binding transcriptional LysR family regulator
MPAASLGKARSLARENTSGLIAFLTIAEEQSFTRAAAALGVSQSALSHTIRGLEARLGVRLLMRTTRSVAPTEAGERLLRTIGPRMRGLELDLASLLEFSTKPSGNIRISADEEGASILWPPLASFLTKHPEVSAEVAIGDDVDIVGGRYDAGVRPGDQVAKDMIAVPIGPGFRMAVVGSPSYFSLRAAPTEPHQLNLHQRVERSLPTSSGLAAWGFAKDGQSVSIRGSGRLVVNSLAAQTAATLQGCGLAYVPETHVADHLTHGRLVRVLDDWCPRLAGYQLYYANRRHPTLAFRLLVEALRYRA